MKYLLLLGLVSCGALEVRHTGNPTVTHKVELDPYMLMKGFTDYCESIVEKEEVDDCINKQLGNFFRVLISTSTKE
jgi:hypothetical protein